MDTLKDMLAKERHKVASMTVLPQGFSMTIVPQPWISVSERLPEGGVEVLVSVDENSDDCGYHVCLYRGDEWVRSEAGYIFGVTHWMPLPEPPEVK